MLCARSASRRGRDRAAPCRLCLVQADFKGLESIREYAKGGREVDVADAMAKILGPEQPASAQAKQQ